MLNKSFQIFYMKMGDKYIIDRLEIEPLKGIAMYTDIPNNIYLDLASRFGKEVSGAASRVEEGERAEFILKFEKRGGAFLWGKRFSLAVCVIPVLDTGIFLISKLSGQVRQ